MRGSDNRIAEDILAAGRRVLMMTPGIDEGTNFGLIYVGLYMIAQEKFSGGTINIDVVAKWFKEQQEDNTDRKDIDDAIILIKGVWERYG